MSQRLDQELVRRNLATTRSQAENLIKLGLVRVDAAHVTKPGALVAPHAKITVETDERFVSRAALKLASVAHDLGIHFTGATMLDVGSSTGGFTDYALQQGATKVIAVDVGTQQLHPSLRDNPKIELHEQTDIRDVHELSTPTQLVVIDVSFISLREILPAVARLVSRDAVVLAMVKPQFEAEQSSLKHKGVIKNDHIRRNILKDFENWVQKLFIIQKKMDSQVAGGKGNVERFYVLKKVH
jgi:23S rRNA (cytidine1920-2'-O)/16S rRNA (cytidine1409-2'-O)-methyltransferase